MGHLVIGNVFVPWSIVREWRTRPESASDVESFLSGFRGEPLVQIVDEKPRSHRERLCWHYRGERTARELAALYRNSAMRQAEREAAETEGAAAFRRGASRNAVPRDYSIRDRKAWQIGWDRERLRALEAVLPSTQREGDADD